MSQIILSYRKDDNRSIAGRLYDHLCDRFGEENIIFGVENLIKPGDDYLEAIHKRVKSAQVLLLLIGRQWQDPFWLSDDNDLDKIAIQEAIANKINLLPVLVDEADLLSLEDFPRDLETLRRRTPVKIREDHFRADVLILMASLETILGVTLDHNDNSDNVSTPPLIQTTSSSRLDLQIHPSSAYTSRSGAVSNIAPFSSKWLALISTGIIIICFFLPWVPGASPFSVLSSGLFFLLALVPLASIISFIAIFVRGIHSSTICAVCGISSLSTLLFFALAIWRISNSLPIVAFLAIGPGVLALAGFLAVRTSHNSSSLRIYVGTVAILSFIFFALFMIDNHMTVFTWLTVAACELILISALLIDKEQTHQTSTLNSLGNTNS